MALPIDRNRNALHQFLGLSVSVGEIENYIAVNKFGENPDIDTISGFEAIWDNGGVYVPPTIARIHQVASSSDDDVGEVVAGGIVDSNSDNCCILDESAQFITDGVSVGDIILFDDTISYAEVAEIVSETELRLVNLSSFSSSGVNNNVSLTLESKILSGTYRIVTNGSTGASILYIQGLDVDLLLASEFVILNGTENVLTNIEYLRQFRARVLGANTTGAIGTITSTAVVDNTISCQVINGNNQSLMAIYTVPKNKTGFLTKWWAALSKKVAVTSSLRLRSGKLDGIGYILQNRSLVTTGGSNSEFYFDLPLIIPGGFDVWVEADSSANDVGIAAGFDLILKDN